MVVPDSKRKAKARSTAKTGSAAAPAPRPARAATTGSTDAALDHGHLLVRRVLDFIRERGLEPGERLPAERVLAERLGVSRNALREALASLTSLRAVEARPNSGIYVKSLGLESSFETTVLLSEAGAAPTATEVAESMEVRLPLERQAISLACARRTAADLAALKRILDDTDRIAAAGGNIIDCDQAFHLALAGASHNSVLVRVLNAFYCLTLPRRRTFFANPKRGARSAADHRKIVAAVERRDARVGVALTEKHLGNARIYWGEVLKPAPRATLKRTPGTGHPKPR